MQPTDWLHYYNQLTLHLLRLAWLIIVHFRLSSSARRVSGRLRTDRSGLAPIDWWLIVDMSYTSQQSASYSRFLWDILIKKYPQLINYAHPSCNWAVVIRALSCAPWTTSDSQVNILAGARERHTSGKSFSQRRIWRCRSDPGKQTDRSRALACAPSPLILTDWLAMLLLGDIPLLVACAVNEHFKRASSMEATLIWIFIAIKPTHPWAEIVWWIAWTWLEDGGDWGDKSNSRLVVIQRTNECLLAPSIDLLSFNKLIRL